MATVCVVVADLIGVALMVPKTYRDPWSETLATFALASLSGALAIGAVGALDASLLLYPVYFCVGNGALALLIWWRRAALSSPAATAGPRRSEPRPRGVRLAAPAGVAPSPTTTRAGSAVTRLPAEEATRVSGNGEIAMTSKPSTLNVISSARTAPRRV